MKLNPVQPGTPDWNIWVTLTRHVDAALRGAEVRPLFSQRGLIALSLWEAGYRPTAEQVEQVAEEDRRRRAEEREADLAFGAMMRDAFSAFTPPMTDPEETR